MNLTFQISMAAAALAGAQALAALLRRPKPLAQWIFAAGMAAFAIESVLAGLSGEAVLPSEAVSWRVWRLSAMSMLPGLWLLFSLTYSRGNYREFLYAWRVPLALAFLLPFGLVIGFRDRLIMTASELVFDSPRLLLLWWPGKCLHILILLAAILVLVNLERTFRASVGTMRWRIKYVVIGLSALFTVRAYTSSQNLLFSAVNPSLDAANSGALCLASVFIIYSVLRARVFAIDLYPSTTFLHHSLILLLAGIYLFIVGVLAKVVTFLGGDAAFPLKAFLILLGLVGLAILLLSERTGQWLKRFVSRHLGRPHYDYRRVWTDFTERTVSLMTEADLCRTAVEFLGETLKVLSVSLWLVDDRRKRLTLGASTSIAATEASRLPTSDFDFARISGDLPQPTSAVDLETSTAGWAEVLRRCQPDFFRQSGNRYCVPLVVGGQLLGFLTLGDRVAGVHFSTEDIELLNCLGEQVANHLHRLHLSQRLLQSKEMEAFQTMSAFFVHDLKNLASSLSLTLKNLPAHFENPAFRVDALRAISKGVARINDLIQRLSLLRQNIELTREAVDLNELVASVLVNLPTSPGPKLHQKLQALPKVLVDSDQFEKIVINLCLNAFEAVGTSGEVTVETSQQNGWAVFSVGDTGCGMSEKFLATSLFRPFQTTKKKGIGIGLFHCKSIVEAHRGRIEVESQEGRGTTFRVLLPLIREEK